MSLDSPLFFPISLLFPSVSLFIPFLSISVSPRPNHWPLKELPSELQAYPCVAKAFSLVARLAIVAEHFS